MLELKRHLIKMRACLEYVLITCCLQSGLQRNRNSRRKGWKVKVVWVSRPLLPFTTISAFCSLNEKVGPEIVKSFKLLYLWLSIAYVFMFPLLPSFLIIQFTAPISPKWLFPGLLLTVKILTYNGKVDRPVIEKNKIKTACSSIYLCK